MKSVMPYLGGKSRLAKEIVKRFPEHTCYCEPFCGAAWVFFEKAPSKVEVLNDFNAELVTLWRVIQNHRDEFLEHFQYALASRWLFGQLKQDDIARLTDIQRAARFYYLQMNCFGGKTTGQSFGVSKTRPPRISKKRLIERIDAAHERLDGVYLENLDALECITRYDKPDTLFYIDPPYYGCENDYAVKFPRERFEELKEHLSGIQGRFIVSLNDLPEVREIFSGFKISSVSLRYSAGTTAASRGKMRNEVLITN